MNKLRLRAINDQRPRSSLNSGQFAETRDHHDDSQNDRPNKRIKKADLNRPHSTISNFFAPKSRSKPLEQIEDDGLVGVKHPWSHDLVRDGSQAETIEGSSVTSNGKGAAATSSLHEYRSVSSRNNVKPSRRRRRPHESKTSTSPITIDDDDTNAIAHRNLPPPPQHVPNSPDCLVTEPPPANIISDVVQSKRPAAEYTQNAPKRFKPLNESDDELSRPGTSSGRDAAKRSTAGKLISRSPQSRSQRGDIQPTAFKSVKPVASHQSLASKGPPQDDLTVDAAVCGQLLFPSKDRLGSVRLHLDADVACPVHETGLDLAWLNISKKKINHVEHGNSHSPIVAIKRAANGQVNGTLVLKFAHAINATLFIKWLLGSSRVIEKSPEYLTKVFDHAMGIAQDYKNHSIEQPGPTTPNNVVKANDWRPQSHSTHRDPFLGSPISPRRVKLKDKMQGLPPPKEKDTQKELVDIGDVYAGLTRSHGPNTRRTRQSTPPTRRERTPDRWTAQNPDWDKDWHRSLVYPPTGKNRATVDKDDIQRLDEGEFLNDNLISFYLRYLQVQLEKERPEILEKVYIFNTFFFEKLRSNRTKINYEGVKAWTARVDLLSYEYIVVPVNENAHWYLAIIYNAPCLLPQEVKAETATKHEPSNSQEAIVVEDNDQVADDSKSPPAGQTPPAADLDVEVSRSTRSRATIDNKVILLNDENVTNPEPAAKSTKRKSTGGNQKFSTDEPRILTLDSLGSPHPPTCRCLRDYLVEEAKHKKGLEIINTPGGMTARGIPQQDNYCDCGVYVLGYMENFLKNPDEAVRRLLHKEDTQWIVKPQEIRAKVRNLLFGFQKEQHLRLEKEKELKRLRRATKGPVSSPQVAPSSPQVPLGEPQTPQVKRAQESPIETGAGRATPGTPRQTATTSAYFAVAPENPIQPQTPKRDEEPSFVQPLRDDSSNESKASSSGDAYHSARSSPADNVPQVLSELNREVPPYRGERVAIKQPSTPHFVQRLSESPSEVRPTASSSTVKKISSPPLTLATRRRPSPSVAQGRRDVIDLESHVIESIEDDRPPPKGPQYDGIDRSIDLTS
ncbi:Ff.00g121280.m01.CDS01 [Fusarium sp. VM40]|nr:Ff.00g121280.m01.CDS01 [Fusarium sp. VM40]